MQKDIGVYVTKKDLKSKLFNQECELHADRITSKDGSTKYGERAKDLAVQYNSKVDTVECGCKTSRLKHCRESSSRYIIATSSPGYRSRSYVESVVGSVRQLPKKRIRKVHLPELNDQAVGSADMTSYIRRNRQPNYSYRSQKKMSSKCVGGFNEIIAGHVVSEKLSPISVVESYNTSPSLPRSDMRKREVTLKDVDIGSGVIKNQLASASVQVETSRHEMKTTLAGNSTINQLVTATTQVEETKREYESKNSVRRTATKYVFSQQIEKSKSQTGQKTNEVLTEKILSSDTVVQVHNLEINSEMKFVEPTEPPDKMNEEEVQEKKSNENQKKDNVMEEDQNKESVLEVDASNDSKEANATTTSGIKNTSMLKRRFEALRRSLCRKEETKKVVKTPSHHTPVSRMSSRSQVNSLINVSIGIASDPPSLVARSYGELSIGPNNATSKHSIKKSITEEKQESSHDVSSKYNSLDSEMSQNVKGMFKLWGKKFNIEGNPEVEGKYAPSYIGSRTKVNEELIDEQPAPKEKDKKRFLFFRSKVKETKKPKEKDAKSKQDFESKQKITTERCEVTCGFSVSSGASSRKKSIMVKKESVKRRESPGELLRQEWLMKYSTNPKESNKSVTLRWNNNGAFPTSSSTVNITEKSYDTDSLLRSASGLTVSDSPATSRPFAQKLKNVNYLQMYQAWMIPHLIVHRPIIPSKSENYGSNMNEVEFLDRQWFIDKSKAFAHQLEVILHTKNLTRFNRNVSSEYITIDIPKDFFSDCSTGNNSPVYPIRLSDEEVYNIVEYETPVNSEITKKKKKKHSKTDETFQGTRFTENIENKINEPPQKVDKDKPKFNDVETQRSEDCDLNHVLGVRIITQRELREARKPNVISMESDYSYVDIHARNSERKCEFAESYLHEYYQKWMSMDLISWCMSYPKFKCYSLKDSRRSFSNEEGTKSCPNIHEEFFTPTFMSRSNIISSHSPYYNVQTQKISHDNVKSVKFLPRNRSSRIRVRDVGRVIPKDSLEVLKKRKINARKNWAYIENQEKKNGTEGTHKKHVSLGVDEIIREILTPVASRIHMSKRSLPSNNRSDSFSLVSDPETVFTHSTEASERSLKCSAVNTKQSEKISHSSTPRLSPKQSHPKVSCSGLKMGVMGILPIESSRHTLSSVDCLRSSVSKMSFHDESEDQSNKISVHIAQSQHNNPVSSLVKLSNSQSLPVVVIESFESDASKCVTTQGTNKGSLHDTESKCEKMPALKTDESKPIIPEEQKTRDKISIAILTPKEETTKRSNIDECDNSIKNKYDKNHQEMIQNIINDSLALKFELEKGKKKDESQNNFKSKETKSKEIIMKQIHDLLTSKLETAIATSQNKSNVLSSHVIEKEEITETVEDLRELNMVSGKGTDKSDCLIYREQIIEVKNTPSETKLLTVSEYPTCKSTSKNTMLSPRTSAHSLCWKTAGGTSARKIFSVEQNVFHENQRIKKISDCDISMKTQHKDVIQINSHEKITVEVKNQNSSTEKIAHDCNDRNGTNKGSAEIKHDVNLWKESAQKRDVLSMYTHQDTCKIYDKKIISKENQLQKKNELSIANVIEIDFKLKVTNGDNSTEVHVVNDGKKQNKINIMKASQDVLVMNENDSKYPINEFVTMDANGNKDINIKIMIKNFKNKTNSSIDNTPHKASKDYINFSNNISERLQTVKSSDLIYSTHKATIDLTGKSGELIAFNNNISHHLSDIIMLSKINTSESYIDMSDIKSVTETRKKKMSIFGKITGRTKERFGKGHTKLSKRSKSDTLASENDVGTETSIDVYSKESNHSKSIKSLDKKAMRQKAYKGIEDTIKLSSEIPSEHASRSKYQEKKELLKKVFQTANCLGKRKTKSRMRRLKTILKSILTSDSSDQDLARHDLIKEITDVSLSIEKSSFTSLNSIVDKIEHPKSYKKHKKPSSADGASENDSVLESNKKSRKGCACSTIAEKLNICGGMGSKGCCCGKPTAKHEETNCNLANEERQSRNISNAESPVITERQNSKNDVCNPNNASKQVHSYHKSNVHVPIVDKEISKETMKESIEPSATPVSNVEEPEITIKEKENVLVDIEAPIVKSVEPEITITEIENSPQDIEAPIVKSVEPEITIKEIKNTLEDIEAPIAKSEEKVNENIENVIQPLTMDDREIISIQDENVDLTKSEINKKDIIVRNVETTVCKPSRDSKKIVITIDKSKKKNEEPKISRKNYDKACISNSNSIRPCAFKMLDRNTKLGISDDDKIIFLSSDSKEVNASVSQCSEKRRHEHKKREETYERTFVGPDILELYETKKAVLQIYAEKRRTIYGEKIVADLPAFMANKESKIYQNYGDLVKHAYCNVCKNVM